MSLIRVTEISDGNDVKIRDNWGRDYQRIFRVEFSAFTHSGGEAVEAIGIRRGNFYVSPNGLFADPMSIAIECEARREDEFSNHYLVTVSYSTKPWEEIAKALASGGTGRTGNKPGGPDGGGGGSGSTDPNSPLNPLAKPWRVSHGSTTIRRRMYRDRGTTGPGGGGKGLVNSAGDPIYYEEEAFVRVITVSRNIPPPTILEQLLYESYINSVNDNTFLGREAKTVLCKSIDGQTEFEEDVPYFSQTLTFWVKQPNPEDPNTDPWTLQLMDNGSQKLVNGKREVIRDSRGDPVTTPVALDGSGGQLSEAQILAGNFIYLSFVEYPPKDFTALGLA